MSRRKPVHRISKPNTSPRRSLRLQSKAEALEKAVCKQLLSPASSQSKKVQRQKRKRDSENLEEYDTSKRLRQSDNSNLLQATHDPVAHWVNHDTWPEDFGKETFNMSHSVDSKQTSNDSSGKRKSESTNRSDRLERLAENGVFMRNSALALKSSKDLCKRLLQGSREPIWWPSYPPKQLPAILERIEGLNEGRIQRDIMPWVVPSAENLFFSGAQVEDWIGDEVQAEWTKCATMGSTKPKPDYVAGLLRKAFTKDEVDRLRNYSSPSRPFLFTAELSFPFVICEAKNGEEGLSKAHRQNIHSASIAVRAIIELYRAAFGKSAPERVEELYGQILVFTVSHNQNIAHLYGHYAVLAEGSTEKLEFYRYEIALFSFTLDDGRDRYRAYNFVVNIYEDFAKEHRKRIKEAAAYLTSLDTRTGLSFSTSELELEKVDAQSNSQEVTQEDGAFQAPGDPASSLQRKQMNRLITQTQQTNDELRSQVKQLLKQLQEQQEQQRRQLERLEQQRKQEREETRLQMEQLIALMKCQKK